VVVDVDVVDVDVVDTTEHPAQVGQLPSVSAEQSLELQCEVGALHTQHWSSSHIC
jgi:hypothetical protein